MNLGIAGRWAVVCGASRGLGYACAAALAAEGVSLVINGRAGESLREAGLRLAGDSGVEVLCVAGDVTEPSVREQLVQAAPQVDILVNNAGGPPPGDFRTFEHADWLAAIEANMLAPIDLIRATVDGMLARRFGRIVNITSSAVKAPIDRLCLSNGARSGLTGFVAGLARTTVSSNVTLNNLLPGAFATERLRKVVAVQAKEAGVDVAVAERAVLATIPAGRFGAPEEFGQACAFLCGAHAGLITGQNLLIDGGAYRGTF